MQEREMQSMARVAHEINRVYCAFLGDTSQLPWDDAPSWQKESSIAGVRGIVEGKITRPSQSHESWLAHKRSEGWTYGPTKDPEKKQHPCLVEFDQLSREQQWKDIFFFAVVTHMLSGLEG